jgi:hypothetical protein
MVWTAVFQLIGASGNPGSPINVIGSAVTVPSKDGVIHFDFC